MGTNENRAPAEDKRQWVRPEMRRMHAGAAESLDGPVPDGGGGAQGS